MTMQVLPLICINSCNLFDYVLKVCLGNQERTWRQHDLNGVFGPSYLINALPNDVLPINWQHISETITAFSESSSLQQHAEAHRFDVNQDTAYLQADLSGLFREYAHSADAPRPHLNARELKEVLQSLDSTPFADQERQAAGHI